jgi:hypothetical protein
MANDKNNQIPEIVPTIEEGDVSIQVNLPFSITWEDQEYHGNFITSLSRNIGGVEICEIEWIDDEIPDFGKYEDEIYENLKKMLLKEVLKRYSV